MKNKITELWKMTPRAARFVLLLSLMAVLLIYMTFNPWLAIALVVIGVAALVLWLAWHLSS